MATVIREMNFMRRTVGQVILASAIIDDTIGWIITAIIFSLALQGHVDAWSVVKSGRVLDDPALTAYVQRVADRLFPEFKGHIRVRILKAQSLNAFALPNGDIYLHEGILARFRNESQLAALLGHEGTHFVDRHSFQSSENVKSTTALGTALAVVGVPVVGLAANLLVVSSVTGKNILGSRWPSVIIRPTTLPKSLRS